MYYSIYIVFIYSSLFLTRPKRPGPNRCSLLKVYIYFIYKFIYTTTIISKLALLKQYVTVYISSSLHRRESDFANVLDCVYMYTKNIPSIVLIKKKFVTKRIWNILVKNTERPRIKSPRRNVL